MGLIHLAFNRAGSEGVRYRVLPSSKDLYDLWIAVSDS